MFWCLGIVYVGLARVVLAMQVLTVCFVSWFTWLQLWLFELLYGFVVFVNVFECVWFTGLQFGKLVLFGNCRFGSANRFGFC